MEAMMQAVGGMDAWTIYAVLGLLVLGESSGVVALVLPGELALLAGGAAAAAGRVSLPLVMAVAIAGAVAGHAVGYEIGRRYGVRLLGWSLVRRHADRVHAAARLVGRYGATAVLLGRWMNVGRVAIPMLAGAGRMRYPAFTLYNVLGGVAWVATFVMLGTAGASIGALHAATGSVTGWLTGAMVVGLGAGIARRRFRRRRSQVPQDAKREGGGGRCTAKLMSSSATGAGA